MSKKGIHVVIDLCGGAEYTAGATHVVLFVDSEMVDSFLKKMDLFGKLQKEEAYTSLSEIRFWFGNPEYCGLGIEDTNDEEARDEAFEKAFEAAGEAVSQKGPWALLDPGLGLEQDRPWVPGRYNVRTELDEVVVSSSGIHFCCVLKHTDSALQTEEISRGHLELWREAIKDA